MCNKPLTDALQPDTIPDQMSIAARLERFVRRVCGLRPGHYIITLKITKGDQAFWTVSEIPDLFEN